MKDYLVTSNYVDNVWIVFAKDAKDAIQQVFDKYIDYPCQKNKFHAKSIASLHNSKGKIIKIEV